MNTDQIAAEAAREFWTKTANTNQSEELLKQIIKAVIEKAYAEGVHDTYLNWKEAKAKQDAIDNLHRILGQKRMEIKWLKEHRAAHVNDQIQQLLEAIDHYGANGGHVAWQRVIEACDVLSAAHASENLPTTKKVR